MAQTSGSGPNQFSGKRAEAVRLYASGLTQQEVANAVGVAYQTVRRWRKDPAFNKAVLDCAYETLKQNLPDIYLVMAKEAKKGSHQHLKIFTDYVLRMEELQSNIGVAQIAFTWERKGS